MIAGPWSTQTSGRTIQTAQVARKVVLVVTKDNFLAVLVVLERDFHRG